MPKKKAATVTPKLTEGERDLLSQMDLADRVIKPVLKANGLKWKGWHAYRRG